MKKEVMKTREERVVYLLSAINSEIKTTEARAVPLPEPKWLHQHRERERQER